MNDSDERKDNSITLGSLLIASLFSVILGIAGSYYMTQYGHKTIPEQQIFTLDTQAVLQAQIGALLKDSVTQEIRDAENDRFPKDLKSLLTHHFKEGHIILKRDAVVGTDQSIDLTKDFISRLVYRP